MPQLEYLFSSSLCYCHTELLLLSCPIGWMIYSVIMCWKSSNRGCLQIWGKEKIPTPPLGNISSSRQWHSTFGSWPLPKRNSRWSFVPSDMWLLYISLPATPATVGLRQEAAGAGFHCIIHCTVQYVHCSGLMCTSALLEECWGVTSVLAHNTSVCIQVYEPVHVFDKSICIYNMSPASVQFKQHQAL